MTLPSRGNDEGVPNGNPSCGPWLESDPVSLLISLPIWGAHGIGPRRLRGKTRVGPGGGDAEMMTGLPVGALLEARKAHSKDPSPCQPRVQGVSRGVGSLCTHATARGVSIATQVCADAKFHACHPPGYSRLAPLPCLLMHVFFRDASNVTLKGLRAFPLSPRATKEVSGKEPSQVRSSATTWFS